MDSFILSIGVVLGLVCLYTVWMVIYTRMRRGDLVAETRLDALRKIEQVRS